MPLEEAREETLWEDAARRLAEIQVATVRQADALHELGVPERTVDVLAHRVPRLLRDGAAMLLGRGCGLTRPEMERVTLYETRLLELCDELGRLPLPPALEHGDLLAKNVLVTLDGPIFQDWAAASISHPFFSLFHLLADARSLVAETSQESRRRLRDVYLEPWREFATRDELVRAFDIARILAPVHLAATAHTELIPATGWRWEVECAVPTNLRLALELLDEAEAQA
jgi:aminoglycoside phosphotransferase (APT) family kinase protein